MQRLSSSSFMALASIIADVPDLTISNPQN